MTVTALDILKAAREYAADPEHIVKNPKHLYEDVSGGHSLPESATRGCIIGCKSIVVCRLGVRGRDSETTATRAISRAARDLHNSDFEAALKSPETIDAVYVRAISILEVTS